MSILSNMYGRGNAFGTVSTGFKKKLCFPYSRKTRDERSPLRRAVCARTVLYVCVQTIIFYVLGRMINLRASHTMIHGGAVATNVAKWFV